MPLDADNTQENRDGEKLRPPSLCHLCLSCLSPLFLSACSASTQPVVKIGLVAPFEGRYRPIGYEAIYAARLAIREINARGGINGHRIELVALDDRGEPDKAIDCGAAVGARSAGGGGGRSSPAR